MVGSFCKSGRLSQAKVRLRRDVVTWARDTFAIMLIMATKVKNYDFSSLQVLQFKISTTAREANLVVAGIKVQCFES